MTDKRLTSDDIANPPCTECGGKDGKHRPSCFYSQANEPLPMSAKEWRRSRRNRKLCVIAFFIVVAAAAVIGLDVLFQWLSAKHWGGI